MFSQTVAYALRAVVQLAHVAPGAQTTEDIARATCVPAAYLSKVLQGLVQAGIVRSQRGIGGGMALARLPGELTILEVVNAVDPIQRIRSCPLNLASHGMRLCPLHQRLDDAMATVETTFQNCTLQELIERPASSDEMCRFPTNQEDPC